MGIAKKQKGHGDTLLWAAVGLLNIQRETAALKSKPPHTGMDICLLYDGFFSFAVVRQIDGLFSYGLHYLWADFQTFRPVYARQIPLDCISRYQLMFRDVRC